MPLPVPARPVTVRIRRAGFRRPRIRPRACGCIAVVAKTVRPCTKAIRAGCVAKVAEMLRSVAAACARPCVREVAHVLARGPEAVVPLRVVERANALRCRPIAVAADPDRRVAEVAEMLRCAGDAPPVDRSRVVFEITDPLCGDTRLGTRYGRSYGGCESSQAESYDAAAHDRVLCPEETDVVRAGRWAKMTPDASPRRQQYQSTCKECARLRCPRR